ncbi:hypothetical protein C8R47DRAFT_1194024 [Mycena vitilis]|nr:hypothetical protein C8R47DRAFT_1194024 [Mycena vitilis]
MTRGNQREQDRLKAAKKLAANAKKPKESATTLQKRKEADAEILRAKQKACDIRLKKEEEKAAATATASDNPLLHPDVHPVPHMAVQMPDIRRYRTAGYPHEGFWMLPLTETT